jgi:hypothetical protein
MKTRFLAALAVSLLLASCVSPIEGRITRNPELFARLTEAERQNVRIGVVKEGMSKDAVFLAWGRPARVAAGKRDGQTFERWSYLQYEPVYYSDFNIGWGYGRCRHDPYYRVGPSVEYVPVPGRAVEFSNGKVSGYLIPR